MTHGMQQLLSLEDFAAIRAKLCETHPGAWLHHYGPAVEAEVLKRLGIELVTPLTPHTPKASS